MTGPSIGHTYCDLIHYIYTNVVTKITLEILIYDMDFIQKLTFHGFIYHNVKILK